MRFIDYKIHEASFKLLSGSEPNKSYKISPKIACNIKKGPDKILCTFTVDLKQTDEKIPFEFSLTAVGAFALEQNDDANKLIVNVAETVYPFVRSSVSELTRMANIPPYVLPLINMSELLNSEAVTQNSSGSFC